ncbi:MAG: glycoside hydrolase family protein [Pseudomonadota bacterium]
MDIIDDLKRDEGLRFKPYQCTASCWTIGIGHNLDDLGLTGEQFKKLLDQGLIKMTISEEGARQLLLDDLALIKRDLDQAFKWWRDLPKGVRDAFLNMAFNLGVPRLKGFKKMLSALETGDFETASREALDSLWARQVGDRARRIAGSIKKGV